MRGSLFTTSVIWMIEYIFYKLQNDNSLLSLNEKVARSMLNCKNVKCYLNFYLWYLIQKYYECFKVLNVSNIVNLSNFGYILH